MIGKSKDHGISQDKIDYVLNVGNRIPQSYKNLIKETHEVFPNDIVYLSHPASGEMLKILVKLINGKRGLEVGVFTGFTSLAIADALPEDGKLISLDRSKEFTDLARKHWELNKVDHKIDLILGDAIETLNKLLEDKNNLNSFDFAYLDADKVNYPIYYEILLQLVRPNGLIIIDNTLYSYKVADPEINDDLTVAIRKMNQIIHDDERVDLNMINFSDGVTLVRKR
jgi:predicted O-methyltransferase YrrM